MVELILEDKQQQQSPQHVPYTNQAPLDGELTKDTSLVKTSAHHHPHHPARKQSTRWQQISHNPRMTNREGQRSTHNTSTQKSCQVQLPSQVSEEPT